MGLIFMLAVEKATMQVRQGEVQSRSLSLSNIEGILSGLAGGMMGRVVGDSSEQFRYSWMTNNREENMSYVDQDLIWI
jgi:hypothetical protein